MMNISKFFKTLPLWRFVWHFLFTFLVLISVIVLVASLVLGSFQEPSVVEVTMSVVRRTALGAALLAGFLSLLLLLYEQIKTGKANGEKLDNLVEMITRNNALLSHLSQAACLSDAAKEIAFRDTEKMELAEAVLGKLHQHDFDETYSMINSMNQLDKYKNLAQQLTRTVERYRNATEKERITQVIAHIDTLCDKYLWRQASVQTENLVSAFPYSEQAKAMPRKVQERKNQRKRQLLALWDQAVQSKDTDQSLEILKDLDMYLTPTEGLALKESASTVFRTKLHNLGVQFALAVTEKKWKDALDAGRQIIRDFPNSRMSHEIRGKMDILQDRAKHTSDE
jgi:hypothetical protein